MKSKRKRKQQTLKIIAVIFLLTIVLVTLSRTLAPHTPNLPQPPLKDLAAAHGIELGNVLHVKDLNNKIYTNILTSQYSFLTIDGEPNWSGASGSLRPSPTTYNYSNIDKIMAFAKAHNMPVQMQHLVWGEQKYLPKWLKNGNYNKAQLLGIIHNHIATVAGHYKGQVARWTVVNEAFTRAQHVYGLRDWWVDHIGDSSYIDDSFIWAHQADPSATLLLNDFDNESINDVSNAEYSYVKDALARGVPIDGIGMQMHIDASNPPSKDDVINNMQRFAALGIKVYVTEFDVNLNSVKGSNDYKNQLQTNIAYDMARACIESKVCVSFGQLGIADRQNWYDPFDFAKSHSYLLDSRYHIKPAFYAFAKAWQQP